MLEIKQFECSPGPHRASGWWGRLTHKWAFMTQTECIYERGNAPAWRAVVREGLPGGGGSLTEIRSWNKQQLPRKEDILDGGDSPGKGLEARRHSWADVQVF